MPRTSRSIARIRRVVRRRHRTWMLSMTLASLGWGCWWLAVALAKFAPDLAPGIVVTQVMADLFAIAGLLCGLFTLRAKLAWILITGVPICANLALIVFPFMLPKLEWLSP
ncbi:MAG: hypothetical protein H6831_08735 [Planctomycetes bacterium]|nr:hypothetical protein [Planctomycetota bacterium]